MTDRPAAIILAGTLPLVDAALMVWLRRRELQAWDGKSSSPSLSGDPATQTVQAIGALDFERANAAAGPTFDRLKIAHPEADDASIKCAIERAVQLEMHCARYFEHSVAGLEAAALRSVERARADNPGFLEASYAAAAKHLCTVMR